MTISQIDLNFEGGLVDQFPRWKDMVKASVYDCGRAFKAIAADLDMSVSELSRKLADNPNDPVNFPLDRLTELIEATEDYRPILWLAEKYLDDAESKRKRAIDHIVSQLPALMQALKVAGVGK